MTFFGHYIFFHIQKFFFFHKLFFSSSLSLRVNGKNEKWHRGVKVHKKFVVYFDRLWGAPQMNQKRHNYVPPQVFIQHLGINQLKTRFKTFFFYFFEKKKRRKKSKHAEKSFECLHHLKSGRNTQQMFIFGWPFEKHGSVLVSNMAWWHKPEDILKTWTTEVNPIKNS